MVFLKEFDSKTSDLTRWSVEDYKKYRKLLINMFYDCFFIDQEETDKKLKAETKKEKPQLNAVEVIYFDKLLNIQENKENTNG